MQIRGSTLGIIDICVFYTALAVSLLIRYGDEQFNAQWSIHWQPFTAVLVCWFVSLYIANLYEHRTLQNGRVFAERLGQAVIMASLLAISFFYLVAVVAITPRANLFLFMIIVTALTVLVRATINTILFRSGKQRVIMVGLNDASLDLAEFLHENPQFGYSVNGIVQLGQESLGVATRTIRWPVLTKLSDLAQLVDQKLVDLIVISPAVYSHDEIIDLLFEALPKKIDFIKLSSLAEQLTGRVPLDAIDQAWFLENIAEGSKKSYETLKRGFDIFGAILLGIPVAIISPFVVAAIWITSPGYPFIHQRRTGLHGKPFALIKFRTMIPDAEAKTGVVWAQENDPRVTRFGRFLRKTRIDELPQIWNILRGDMSIVGPRAERPEFDSQLKMHVPFYPERYLIKPGLSGWAQINPPYYYASIQDAIRKVEYDLYYIAHRSFGLDVEIILKTISIALRRAGR